MMLKQFKPFAPAGFLQLFADGEGAGAAGTGDTGQEGATPPAGNEPPVIDAEKLKFDAQTEFLKSLGFEKADDLKGILEAHRQQEEAKKTADQKNAEKLTAYEKQVKEYETTVFNLQAEKAALQAGVTAEAAADVITLAKAMVTKDTDITKAVAEVVKKYPHFAVVQPKQEEKKPRFSFGQHQQETKSTVQSLRDALATKFKN